MRNILLAIKRWHFWVLCPLLLLLAVVFWFLGVGGLDKQTEQNRSTINGLYTTVSSVRSIEQHPNQKIVEGMDALIAQRREEVAKAWTEKYRQQTADDGTLAWPEELGKKFIDQVKDLRPIEKMVDCPPAKEMILDDRRRYQEHIAMELPKLAKMIGAKWFLDPSENESMTPMEGSGERSRRRPMGDAGIRSGMNQPTGESLSEQALVEWSPKNQMEILSEHFPWGASGMATPSPEGGAFRDQFSSIDTQAEFPNLLEILYAQEDLWVLQAIMNVIARTNEGASARFNAIVKEIDFIRMGKSAVSSKGHITRLGGLAADPSATSSYESGEMAPSSHGGEQTPSSMHGGDAGEGEGPVEMVADPAEGRYVNDQYASLSATQLRQVMRDFQQVDPALAYLAVAKRVPVRFRVKIDQAGLDRLLTECANSPLTIEVRQVRINPSDDGASSEFSNYGGGDFRSPGGDFRSSSRPLTESSTSLLPGSHLAGADAIDAQSTTDVTAEIYGIVYIYNPVDEQVLGTVSEKM